MVDLFNSFKNIELDACFHLSTAYAYKVFYLLEPKFKDDLIMMNTLHKSIAVNFGKSLYLLKNSEGSQFHSFEDMKRAADTHRLFHFTFIHLTMYKDYKQKHYEDVAGGFLGF